MSQDSVGHRRVAPRALQGHPTWSKRISISGLWLRNPRQLHQPDAHLEKTEKPVLLFAEANARPFESDALREARGDGNSANRVARASILGSLRSTLALIDTEARKRPENKTRGGGRGQRGHSGSGASLRGDSRSLPAPRARSPDRGCHQPGAAPHLPPRRRLPLQLLAAAEARPLRLSGPLRPLRRDESASSWGKYPNSGF